MEELKKVDLTGSFSLLTRDGRRCPWIHALQLLLASDGEEARRPGTTEGGGAAMRGETAREAGREGRSRGAEVADARRRSAARREVWGSGGSPSGSGGAAEKKEEFVVRRGIPGLPQSDGLRGRTK